MGQIRKAKEGPEHKIQRALIEYLECRGWLVERMANGAFQTGVPDLYCHHPKWGCRWIDVKNPGKYSFTKAQRIKWPQWESYRLGIWILTAANQTEYDKLFAAPNFRNYWKKSWGPIPTQDEINKLLDAIE